MCVFVILLTSGTSQIILLWLLLSMPTMYSIKAAGDISYRKQRFPLTVNDIRTEKETSPRTYNLT